MIQDSFSPSINWELKKKKNTAIVYVKIKYVFILITLPEWKGLKKGIHGVLKDLVGKTMNNQYFCSP